MGARRGVDGREGGVRAEPGRRADRVPLPRPRRQSRDGTACAGHVRAVPVLVDGEPPGAAHGLDVDEQGHGTLSEQRLLPADSRARFDRATGRSRSRSSLPASRPTRSPSAKRVRGRDYLVVRANRGVGRGMRSSFSSASPTEPGTASSMNSQRSSSVLGREIIETILLIPYANSSPVHDRDQFDSAARPVPMATPPHHLYAVG